MTNLTAQFNTKDFEYFDSTNYYLTTEQVNAVALVETRVNSQLDWLAQMLGWNGPQYWGNLADTVSQKRNLQVGTFGVYNGYIIPEIVEIRNWENTVVIREDPRVQVSQIFYLGDAEYTPTSIERVGNNYHVYFENLPDQFYIDISNNLPLKVLSKPSIPEPFRRTEPFYNASASFLTSVSGTSLALFPSYDTNLSTPYLLNSLVLGSRYFFDKPVRLQSSTVVINPQYDFTSEQWFLDVPTQGSDSNLGTEALLTYDSASLPILLTPWVDPSDWLNSDIINNFKGVWSNKGGKLPYHFVFDALSIHGFDEKKSVILPSFSRSLNFDELLEFVYFQKSEVSPSPPPPNSTVWWNSQTGSFSIHLNDSLNCGPWTEVDYPNPPIQPSVPDYVLPDFASFLAIESSIQEGDLVEILDISGMAPGAGIEGVTATLTGPGSARLFKKKDSSYWTLHGITFANEADFSSNAAAVPPKVPVHLQDSDNLQSQTVTYTVSNLSFTIQDPYPLNLMKSDGTGKWYIAPPSELKYIGNTRLFESSLDYANPVSGELNWDFTQSDPALRMARLFYYNDWQQDPFTSEWYLTGDWVAVNSNFTTNPVPQVVNYGAVKVYCDGYLLTAGTSFRTDDFQLTYTVDSLNGTFDFSYFPLSSRGTFSPPQVTISDSLTSAFTYDISRLVFSGLSYYMSPNVADTMTLLRVWKSEPLKVIDSLSELEILRNSNPLRADINSGPGDENWERYFLRLPPAYGRNESKWQKVNLVCQNFGYWGSSINPERTGPPAIVEKPTLYEEVYYGDENNVQGPIYYEPYLFSGMAFSTEGTEVFGPSFFIPESTSELGEFSPSQIVPFDPLHNRRADTSLPVGGGFGKWEGSYYRKAFCRELTGFESVDREDESLEPLPNPVWDASIYEVPPLPSFNEESGVVDTNHYKVGYAFFAADLSAAEEGFFDFALNG